MAKHIDNNLVKIAASQDVFDILVRDGIPMTFSNGVYRHREHDSMVITPGKGFYWFSKGYGSKNPVDYYINVEGLNFVDSCYKVLEVMNYTFERKNIVVAKDINPNINYIANSFNLPEKDNDNKRVFAYLTKTRGIDKNLVKELIDTGLIYQDKEYKNAVFIGKDYDGNIVSAFKRSTLTIGNNSWRGDEKGSQKEFRFRIENKTNSTVNVFESEIDLLSYVSLQPLLARNENYISLGGLSEKALMEFLKSNNQVTDINVCSDNDEAGWKLLNDITDNFGDRYYITREIPVNKDFNKDLINKIPYERNRIEVISFNDEKSLTKKEKIKMIRDIFREKYEGKRITLDFPNRIKNTLNSDAYIDKTTRHNYRSQNIIENNRAFQNRLDLALQKDLEEIIRKSNYTSSQKETKENYNIKHTGNNGWHYFKRELIIGGYLYDFLIDIREDKNHETYIHKIRLDEIDKVMEKSFKYNNSDTPLRISTKETSKCSRLSLVYNNGISNDNKSQVVEDLTSAQVGQKLENEKKELKFSFSTDKDQEMEF